MFFTFSCKAATREQKSVKLHSCTYNEFFRYFDQSRIVRIFFNENLLFLVQMPKLRKIRETNWWKHLMNTCIIGYGIIAQLCQIMTKYCSISFFRCTQTIPALVLEEFNDKQPCDSARNHLCLSDLQRGGQCLKSVAKITHNFCLLVQS